MTIFKNIFYVTFACLLGALYQPSLAEQAPEQKQVLPVNLQDNSAVANLDNAKNLDTSSQMDVGNSTTSAYTQVSNQGTESTQTNSSSNISIENTNATETSKPFANTNQVEKLPEYKPLSQTSRSGALSTSLNTPGGIIQWFLSTLGVLFFIFLIAYFLKKSKFVQRTVGSMQVTGQLALGQKERLVKVNIDGKVLLLGVTSQNISLIYDLTENNEQEQGKVKESKAKSTKSASNHKNVSAIMQNLSKANAHANSMPDLESDPYSKPPTKNKKSWYQSKQEFFARHEQDPDFDLKDLSQDEVLATKESQNSEPSKEEPNQNSQAFKDEFNQALEQSSQEVPSKSTEPSTQKEKSE